MHGYSLDHICLRDKQLFFYGWGFNPHIDVKCIMFRYIGTDKKTRAISVDYGRARSDVKQTFPDIERASNCGFLLLSGIETTEIKECFLDWYFADESKEVIKIDLQQVTNKTSILQKLNHTLVNAFRLLETIKRSGIKAGYSKAKRYLSKKPIHLTDDQWSEVRGFLSKKDIFIIIDHDMGGGANIFRSELVKEQIEKNNIVILLSYHIPSLQFFLQIFSSENSERYLIDDIYDLFDLIHLGKVNSVFYNCAVTFRSPLEIPRLLLSIKQLTNCSIIVAVHDYFIACPSHFLLNSQYTFCNIPSKNTCASCLEENTDGFVKLSGCKDITEWRSHWKKLLIQADEVRLFSKSSFTLLQKAFPDVKTKSWTIKPHTVRSRNLIAVSSGNQLNIGIVGAIGRHKGSEIVQAIAQEIENRQLDMKISVIGTIEARCSPDIVSVTGPYEADALPGLIKHSGANVFLFPSICPETFSYVSHELIGMGLPFSCFDLGAPADLAKNYEKGMLLTSIEPSKIIEDLEQFRQKIYNL